MEKEINIIILINKRAFREKGNQYDQQRIKITGSMVKRNIFQEEERKNENRRETGERQIRYFIDEETEQVYLSLSQTS